MYKILSGVGVEILEIIKSFLLGSVLPLHLIHLTLFPMISMLSESFAKFLPIAITSPTDFIEE